MTLLFACQEPSAVPPAAAPARSVTRPVHAAPPTPRVINAAALAQRLELWEKKGKPRRLARDLIGQLT